MYLTLFIILALVSLLCAQSTNQTNLTNACAECVCAVSGNSTTFARGNTAYLCAHFISVNQNTSEVELQRAAFPIVVDDFTSVQLQGGQTHFNQFNYTEIVVQLHGSIMSTPLTYIQMTPQQFYSSAFSVVIQVNLGVIQSVIWDHECATCGSSDCFAFSTASGSTIDTICNSPSCVTGNDSSCDPQIFITWIGTDVNNVKMTSAGMRLSLFRQFSTAELLSANTIPAYVIPNVSNSSSSSNSSNSSSNSSQGNSSNQTGNETNPNESGQNATTNGTQNTTNNNTQQNEDGDNTDNENDNSTNTNNNEGNNQNQGEGTQTGNENGSQSGENTNTNEETNQNGSGENTNTNEGGESQTGNENDGGTGGTNGTTPGTGSETGSGGTNTETGGNGGTDETDTEGSNTSGESQNPSQITN